jgi:uncharacterized protein YkwD
VPKGPGFLGSEAGVLNRGLVRINTALGTELRPDNRLARAARWVYENLGPDRALPSQAVMDVLTHRLGLPEPTVHLLVTGAPDAPRAADIVSSRLARLFDVRAYTHIGGVAEREPGGVVVVVALGRRPLRLRPVPRQLAAPGPIWFGGRLVGPYRRPELAHTLPDGRTTTQALGEGREFGLLVGLAPEGRHRLEIVADGPDGPTVVVNFPVFVGVPVEATAEAREPRGRAHRANEVRDALFKLVNAERAKAGLEPLAADAELDDVALRHSEDMRDHGFVAHVSPTTGSTEERLAHAGIVTGLAAENVAKGYGAEELHRGFMESPGHRGAVLLAGATHVGLGVASEKEGGRTTYYATEIFIRRVPSIGPNAKTDLLLELNGLRAAAGLSRLEEDGRLGELAEASARSYLLDPSLSQDDVLGRLRQRIRATVRDRASIRILFAVVGSPEEGAKQAAADPGTKRARRVGIGVAQGDRPGQPPNTIVLVIIFAD